ncbi:MAG TPA: L-ribulose-5-phosphate 4-epimerase [Spirochaetaceae bacterium]|nr:L-ribulose-5-phosphate 4-epimerase [Spirochaetaceae bacterium]
MSTPKAYGSLKQECYELNMEIPRRKLALYTWGNVSVIDRAAGVFAIKPSGVPYDELRIEDIVIVDLDAQVVEGLLKPSSDARTHAVLYRSFDGIGGIVHTHSCYAVAWAQALMPIPIFGTTHADHTVHAIPCTPPMADERIDGDYEEETGVQIVEHFRELNLSPHETQMVLVGSHGPFAWGISGAKAVYNAVVLEELAKMAFITRQLNPTAPPLKEAIRRKHYERKHGPNAYYGQPRTKE